MVDVDLLMLCSKLVESNLNWFFLKEDIKETRFLLIFGNTYVLMVVLEKITIRIWVYLKKSRVRKTRKVQQFPYERVDPINISASVEVTDISTITKFITTFNPKTLVLKRFEVEQQSFNKFVDLVLDSVQKQSYARGYLYGTYTNLVLKCDLS